MKDIKIFVHATDIAGDISITQEQINLLKHTGLLDIAKEVRICTHYSEDSFNQLKSQLCDYTNVSFKHFGREYQEWYEYTTCLELQEDSYVSDEYYALYLHNKGAFTKTLQNYNWRQYMQYFCVEKWKECVSKLNEGFELVGAAYLDNTEEYGKCPQHYFAGNFFWTNSKIGRAHV